MIRFALYGVAGLLVTIVVAAAGGLAGAQGRPPGKELVIALAAPITAIDPHYHNLTPNNNVPRTSSATSSSATRSRSLKPGLATDGRRSTTPPGSSSCARASSSTTARLHRRRRRRHRSSACRRCRTARRRSPPTPSRSIEDRGGRSAHDPLQDGAAVSADAVATWRGSRSSPRAHVERQRPTTSTAGKAAIGTGPYKLVEYRTSDRVELARNDAYWGGKPPWEQGDAAHPRRRTPRASRRCCPATCR